MTDTDRTDAIRARAHRLWEAEGCPEGKEAEHWARAEAEMDEEDRHATATMPAPEATRPEAEAPAKASRKRAAKK